MRLSLSLSPPIWAGGWPWHGRNWRRRGEGKAEAMPFTREATLRGAAATVARHSKPDLSDRAALLAWLCRRRQIDPTTGCWLWTGGTSGQMEYGSVKLPRQRRKVYVHRLAAHLSWGFNLDSPAQIHHSCDTPRC